ncbi:MAG: hypothetical protein RL380_998 [Verrucomicrobiota bacterium]|jgi:glycosyltransferase involved in cell wall biosynthesis
MKISVIVPAFNEEKLISDSLAATRAAMAVFTERGWTTELIVCDNNSSDRTAELARAAGATVVFEPVNMISRARNAGARIATGDWFVFVDADTYPSRELFSDMAEAALSGKYVGGSANVVVDGNNPDAIRTARFWNFLQSRYKWFVGLFNFVEAKAFRAVGGFDPERFGAEDIRMANVLKAYARPLGLDIVVLTAHPALTSARKAHLYKKRDFLKLGWRSLITWGNAWRDKDACHIWYDGKR